MVKLPDGALGPSVGPFHSVCGLVRSATIAFASSTDILSWMTGSGHAGYGSDRVSAEAALDTSPAATSATPASALRTSSRDTGRVHKSFNMHFLLIFIFWVVSLTGIRHQSANESAYSAATLRDSSGREPTRLTSSRNLRAPSGVLHGAELIEEACSMLISASPLGWADSARPGDPAPASTSRSRFRYSECLIL